MLIDLDAENMISGDTAVGCISCKKIEDKNGKWFLPEVNESHLHGLRLSRGLCPDCANLIYASVHSVSKKYKKFPIEDSQPI